MKPLCARTIKGVIASVSFIGFADFIVQLLIGLARSYQICDYEESECTKRIWMIMGISLGGSLFLGIAFVLIRRRLILCFPVACGHRRCIFTGRSSKPLRDILLGVDKEIPSEGELQEYRDKSLLYLNDIKAQFESTMTTKTFQFIFSGSAIERHGVPFMMSYKPKCCLCNALCSIHALHTDLDVMFYSLEDRACFSGQGNILVEPFVNETSGFTGYATLSSLEPGYEGYCVSSKVIRDQAKRAAENASVANLPGVPCCCGRCEVTPKIELVSKGPAMKINFTPLFEADITLCFHCPEWPTSVQMHPVSIWLKEYSRSGDIWYANKQHPKDKFL